MRNLCKALLLALALVGPAHAQDAKPKPEELEALTAQIALYPDSLVAQILMASTYPLEIVEAGRWSKANPSLKEKALEDALEKQSWDPSVKSLTAFPQVLGMLNEKLDMTQKLGDAFLADQKSVLDAIQRLRTKAQAAGNLKSSKEQTVSSAQEGGTTVIKIEPASPQTVYVPAYNPSTVYGTWPYPAYPPYYYPYPGYVPGAAFVGFMAGAIVGGALWGNCNWGGGNVNINTNRYNSFNRTNVSNGNWNHNAEHRKGVGYKDSASQQKFGGGQRAGADSREQFRGRAEQGRQDIGRGEADRFKGGGDRGGVSDRAGAGAGDRGGAGGGDRGGGLGGGDRGGGSRPSAGTSDRGGGGQDFGGGSRGGSSGFSGAGGGGAQTRDASSRGGASRGGGGFSGGGGGGARAGGGGGGRAGGGGGGRGGRR